MTTTNTTISTAWSSTSPSSTDPADLVARIEALARDQNILRVKGYAAVAGKPMRLLVQAVGARVRHQYDQPWGRARPAGAAGGDRRT
jgi:G3E family GTPase